MAWELPSIMKTVNTPDSSDSEALQQLVKNNSCDMCHALGLPRCQGHGQDGAGADDTGSDSHQGMDTSKDNNTPLEKSLEQNKNWRRQHGAQDEDSVFNYFNPHALAAIKLDFSKGSLTFFAARVYKSMLKAERDLMDGLFTAIEKTLIAFKNELAAAGEFTQQISMKRIDGSLVISIPNTKHYDAFVKRLLDRNLLANRPESTPTKKKEEKNQIKVKYQSAPEPETTHAHTPTPFSMRPKPKGWNDKK